MTLGSVCSSFPSSLRCKVRLLIWDLPCFLIQAFITINLPLRTAFTIISLNMFCFHFYLSFSIFKFPFWFLLWPIGCSEACCLISTYLWIFQFSSCNWFLVLYHCDWKHTDMISVFLNLLRFVLWPNIWSILENVPCVLRRKVLCLSIKSIGLMCWLKCVV